ncbi:kinase-like domain-containing protein [Aspergillus stella-maris]|uniref:kinase-like domain-containing protein n=1 Tax=Aspergillus stella-maris TaxID=1810926 RepID=UPI003CCCEA33
MERFMTPFVDPASRATDSAFPLDSTDIQTLPNESLADLLFTSPALYDLGQTTVVRLSKTIAMKGGGNVLPSEAAILQIVASECSIRAPRVHRAWQVEDDTKYFGTMGYIVMDYVDGRPLDGCWDNLSANKKLQIARQVAEIIMKLQSINISVPGPIGGGPCRGRFFSHYSAGPFADASDMEKWFNHKLTISRNWKKAPEDIPDFHFSEFVLTHQDISPRNLVLDDNGQLWLMDWADAGAYPRAFENAALESQDSFPDFNAMVLSFLPRYPEEEKKLQAIGYVLSVAPLA